MSQAFHGGRWREARERFGRDDFLDFSVNTNPFWTAPTSLDADAARAAWARYPEADAEGTSRLLARTLGADPAHMLATAGAIEALYLAARLFTGRTAHILQPGFADYGRACSAAGVHCRSVAVPPGSTHLQPFIPVLSGADVVVMGTPVNPTGRLFGDLLETITHPALAGTSWILDEAFIDFTPGGAAAHSRLRELDSLPHVLLLGALTKSWGLPGLRLGFAATGSTEWMHRLRAMQPPWSVNGFAEQWARSHLHANNHAAMRRSLEQLPSAREMLRAAMGAVPGLRVLESDANFLLVESLSASARCIAEDLGREGILVRVCDGFENLDPERFLRVAVRGTADNRRLVESLVRACAPSTAVGPGRVLARSAGVADSPAPSRLTVAGAPRVREMRAVSVLGTSSNSGKSWMATALCALLRRRGLRVAPFKAQNMSNNSAVSWEGGEMGRAQAVQAEACGLPPSVRMNPILLKPSGAIGSQLVVLGEARGHVAAGEYYKQIDSLWPVVTESLQYWGERSDVLVLEGAGSPVELNLLHRDLVNLRPVRHLDGRWLLVADIERGGVFAQAAGTWRLVSGEDQRRCIGLVVNKFRGDLALFSDAGMHFAPHFQAPYLGTLPFRGDLQPEDEDSLCIENQPQTSPTPGEGCIEWIRFPHVSNAQDAAPWGEDAGIRIRWTADPATVSKARVVVLPGSKNTIADLGWMHRTGLAEAVVAAHAAGAQVVGICGGFQMLGLEVSDPEGLAGDAGSVKGLGLLPVRTVFSRQKEVRAVAAEWRGEVWQGYEIHMGQTRVCGGKVVPFLKVADSEAGALGVPADAAWRAEGAIGERVWGTYLHGLFECAQIRAALAGIAGAERYQTARQSWRERRRALYESMADLLEEHLNLEPLWRYVAD